MKRALKILNTYSKRLRHQIKELQSYVRPASYHDGLIKLPDEVLQEILLKTLLPSGPFPWDLRRMSDNYKNLSLTCQRFYRNLSSCSNLWSYASDKMSNAMLQYFLGRRGSSCPLKIELLSHERASSQSKTDTISQLLPIINHWSSIRVKPDLPLLRKIFPIEATSVRSLEVSCILLAERFNDEIPRFHRYWSFPNVEKLRYLYVVPPPGLFTKLTKCELVMIKSVHEYADADKLMDFLATAPLLQSLIVEFDGRLEFYIDNPASSTVKVHLDFLKEFAFKSLAGVGFGSESQVELLTVFMASLAMPNVEHFTCSMAAQLLDYDDGRNWVNQLFPSQRQYSKLRHLKLCMPMSIQGNAFPIEFLFARLPTIETFELDIPHFSIIRASFYIAHFSHLRSMTLRDQKEMRPSDIINVICRLQGGIELTTLTIATTNYIDEEILSSYLPQTRLIYESGLVWV